ncbi:MAG: hypothetical protein ACOYL5_17905 [Phototrophicaceae bacterium]|jgi:hypothetical protein
MSKIRDMNDSRDTLETLDTADLMALIVELRNRITQQAANQTYRQIIGVARRTNPYPPKASSRPSLWR